MNRTTTPTRARGRVSSVLAGLFLATTASFAAASPVAAVEPVADTGVDALVQTSDIAADLTADLQQAADLQEAIAEIPTETLPLTGERLAKIQAKVATRVSSRARRSASEGARALAAARTQAGDAYSYGAVGPNAYDCSGLTMWAYARVGEALPHSSSAQVGRTTRVSRPGIGDLVFFTSGGSVYHVGLYAGGGRVFHASRPGTPVGLAKIWTKSVFFGHVR